MTRYMHDLGIISEIPTNAPNNIPLYSVVKIHGSTGWKSIPLTLSLRANSCLCILYTVLALLAAIIPTTTDSRNSKLLFLRCGGGCAILTFQLHIQISWSSGPLGMATYLYV